MFDIVLSVFIYFTQFFTAFLSSDIWLHWVILAIVFFFYFVFVGQLFTRKRVV